MTEHEQSTLNDPEAKPKPSVLITIKEYLKKPKNIATVLGWLFLLSAIIFFLVSRMNGSQGKTSNTQNELAGEVIERPGYDTQQLPVQISDPYALTFKSVAQPVKYNSKPIVQACNLLPIDAVTSQGGIIDANIGKATVSSKIYDGKSGLGFANIPQPPAITLGTASDGYMTGCSYYLKGGTSTTRFISVTSFQLDIVPDDLLVGALSRLEPQAPSKGLTIYKSKNSGSGSSHYGANEQYVAFKRGFGGFSLMTDGTAANSEFFQRLFAITIDNFIKEQTATSGISEIAFDSPLFKKSTFNACSVFINEDMRAFTGKDAVPIAEQYVAPYIANAPLRGKPTRDFYTNNSCTRKTAAEKYNDEVELTLTVHTFLEEKPAKYWAENAETDGGWKRIPEIGGGLYYSDREATLYFSKGRAKFSLAANGRLNPKAPVLTASEAEHSLVSIAKAIMSRQQYQ